MNVNNCPISLASISPGYTLMSDSRIYRHKESKFHYAKRLKPMVHYSIELESKAKKAYKRKIGLGAGIIPPMFKNQYAKNNPEALSHDGRIFATYSSEDKKKKRIRKMVMFNERGMCKVT